MTEVVGSSFHQPVAQVNYPELSVAFTRIHEPKHISVRDVACTDSTVIMKEIPDDGADPAYPVNSMEDRQTLARYQTLARRDPLLVLGGRLGSYRYLDMDETVAMALRTVKYLRF